MIKLRSRNSSPAILLCPAVWLLPLGIACFYTSEAVGECTVVLTEVSREANDTITVAGSSTACPKVGIRWIAPGLPQKSVLVTYYQGSEFERWSVKYGPEDGLTAEVLRTLQCSSANFQVEAFCDNGQPCTFTDDMHPRIVGCKSHPPVGCPPQLTLLVTDAPADNTPPDTNACLIAANYLVSIVEVLPPTATISWSVNGSPGASGPAPFPISINPGQLLQVSVALVADLDPNPPNPDCIRTAAVSLEACACAIVDVEVHLLPCNRATGTQTVTVEAELDGIPGEEMTGELSVLAANGTLMDSDLANDSDGDIYLETEPLPLTNGDYAVQVTLNGGVGCQQEISETFSVECEATPPDDDDDPPPEDDDDDDPPPEDDDDDAPPPDDDDDNPPPPDPGLD